MALDGIVIANLVRELKDAVEGGHISKIAMPEKNELFLTIKNHAQNHRLLISCDASLPLIYLSEENKPSPPAAPGFCMLLRKHIGSGRITEISQPGLERIIRITTEQLNELGDLTKKRLYIELMGKHSNIIFTDEDDLIIDSMRHVPATVSSLREVLPGRTWFLPEQLKKTDPLSADPDVFAAALRGAGNVPLDKAVYTSFSGISPVVASEILSAAGLDPRQDSASLTEEELARLYRSFALYMEEIRSGHFSPTMYLKNDRPEEFSSLPLSAFSGGGYTVKPYESVSRLLYDFYSLRDSASRIRQKSTDLRKLVTTALERSSRKLILQEKQLKDTEKKDKFRVWGDLISTYGYMLSGGEKELVCENYYDGGKEIRIPLDEQLTASKNAKKYYDRYAKLKRTEEAVTEELEKTRSENAHLASILTSLDLATEESDLNQIREELADYKFIRRHVVKGKKQKIVSKPLHFVSSDGFDIYVGKNNYQNEEITFRIASGSDWWFHAKGIPGSHVIVKCGQQELPDRTFEEAAALAAWYSKGRDGDKVEVDYIQRRHVKKTTGGPPGFVIYHTNWSMMAHPRPDIPKD